MIILITSVTYHQINTIKHMKYIKRLDREQFILFLASLEVAIDEDSEVYIIDLFVESIDLSFVS